MSRCHVIFLILFRLLSLSSSFSCNRGCLGIAVLLMAQCQVGFGSMVELTASIENNHIMLKQLNASWYPVPLFVLAAVAVGIPIFLAEAAILTLFIYFMSGFVLEVGRFFVFFAVMVLCSLIMSVWFRMIAAMSRDEPTAQVRTMI